MTREDAYDLALAGEGRDDEGFGRVQLVEQPGCLRVRVRWPVGLVLRALDDDRACFVEAAPVVRGRCERIGTHEGGIISSRIGATGHRRQGQ